MSAKLKEEKKIRKKPEYAPRIHDKQCQLRNLKKILKYKVSKTINDTN